MIVIVKVVVAAGLDNDIGRIRKAFETCFFRVVWIGDNPRAIAAFDQKAGLTVPGDVRDKSPAAIICLKWLAQIPLLRINFFEWNYEATL